MFLEFINEYGMDILYTIVTAVAGYIGIVIKNVVVKYFNDKTKQSVAKTAVKFVEQVYKELHGEEKLNAAIAAASEMLAEKGIGVSELEMRVLIEAAVGEFNDAFNKTVVEVEPEEKEGE